jgi:hypothetical protein
MRGFVDTAGEQLAIECSLPWVEDLIVEGVGGELHVNDAPDPSLRVIVEAERQPFPTAGWRLLARGARHKRREVVVENACTAGFDLHLSCTAQRAEFSYRWRPPPRDRAAARLLRSRFHLLARAVLMQYPALWWAGTRGRVPLHASACTAGGSVALITAPSGVGRSTLILGELNRGERATSDNLAAGDGRTVWGLVEPLRIEGGEGRSMPHGRRESALRGRAESLVPDLLLVLERKSAGPSRAFAITPGAAAQSLVASTYMAGELRRFWPFAATLAAGTGLGPAHPPVTDVASAFAARLPCFALDLGARPAPSLGQLLEAQETKACA